ncbi:MAG: hypothetical protein CFE33_17980 [Pseudorhodobacter sp. PARRP1]|nr:MAG: hypothetical protein CFE33_17980 [Pseudorhodobacter sp. PARRP1]
MKHSNVAVVFVMDCNDLRFVMLRLTKPPWIWGQSADRGGGDVRRALFGRDQARFLRRSDRGG